MSNIIFPERMPIPGPLWRDARQPYGDPLNAADIRGAELFNLALDEVARLNAGRAVAVPDGWVRAVDQEMVCSHIGVASADDSYELARDKLASLIGWHVQVAIDPAVNGGKLLVPVDQLCRVVRGDPSLGANAMLLVDAWKAMAGIRAMLAAAPSVQQKESGDE